MSRLLRAETALDTLERTRREDHATMQRLESDVRQLGDVGQR